MRTKILNRRSMFRNIAGLSLGDRAYCGPYGTVTCIKAASEARDGVRRFKVAGSKKLANGGNWTLKGLREAISLVD